MFAAKIFYTFLLTPEQSQWTVLTNPVSQIIKFQAVMKNYWFKKQNKEKKNHKKHTQHFLQLHIYIDTWQKMCKWHLAASLLWEKSRLKPL